ncbi:hypothetical protein D0Y65_024114 [Glycine soja]|uniref:Uncharacterized protein n=1 Tax=Glycine soja TaxID=3848 RepID=A0A445J0S0_GLYSO|nr:hypothetical protein D0Y65_024114 [Glycine soja]RZB91971.1 hypothetical protein D0Y65_024114 [Glycine soja]
MRKNNEVQEVVVITPRQEEIQGSGGHIRNSKDGIWWPVTKTLPRSTAVLLFPVVLIIAALAYTRTLDTHRHVAEFLSNR